jgi:hypothetical protein
MQLFDTTTGTMAWQFRFSSKDKLIGTTIGRKYAIGIFWIELDQSTKVTNSSPVFDPPILLSTTITNPPTHCYLFNLMYATNRYMFLH